MNKEGTIYSSADPARNEPSQARLESRSFEKGGREPDPTDFFIRLMKRAAEIGAARLEAAHERSEAERRARQAAQDRADLAYERVTRAMRYCAALAVRFHKERLDQEMKKAAEVAVENKQRRSRRKGQLERVVKDAIQHEAKERDAAVKGEDFDRSFDAFDLRKALSERLEDEDIERDLDRRPLSELIARICRDLGITPEWSRWQNAFWALEEARQKPPGSPYAAPPPAPEAPRSATAEPPEPEPAAAAEAEDPKPPEAKPPEPAPEVPAPPPTRFLGPRQVQPEEVHRAERERQEQRVLAGHARYHRRE
jgi:hypothetical protein